MDKLNAYRDIVERVLDPYTSIRYAHGDLHCDAIFDRQRSAGTKIPLHIHDHQGIAVVKFDGLHSHRQ